MTNKKNRNKHQQHHQHQHQPAAPKVEISEEELLAQCLELHDLIKNRTTRLKELETGNLCYILSTKWLNEWKDFVGYRSIVGDGDKPDKKYYGKRLPGKINIDIIASQYETKDFYTLPKEMKDYEFFGQLINEKKDKDDDYIAITEDIWLAFLQYYEGEAIMRPVRKLKGSLYYDS